MEAVPLSFMPRFPDLSISCVDSILWFYSQHTYVSYNITKQTTARLHGWIVDLGEHCTQTDAYTAEQLHNYLAECFKCSRYEVAYYTKYQLDSSHQLPPMTQLHWQPFSNTVANAVLPLWLPINLTSGPQPLNGCCGLYIDPMLQQVCCLGFFQQALYLTPKLQQLLSTQLQQQFPNLNIKLLLLTPFGHTPESPITLVPVLEAIQQILTANFPYHLWRIGYSATLQLADILQASAGINLRSEHTGFTELLQRRYSQPITVTRTQQQLTITTSQTDQLTYCNLWIA